MQKGIRTTNGPICAKVTIPGAKNISYRALLMASLANGVSEISGLPINSAIKTLTNALSQLGIVVQLDEKSQSCIIAGCNGQFPKKQASIWCDNTKILSYYLTAACIATPGVYYFDGVPALYKKTVPLLDLLRKHGTQFIPSDTQHMPYTLVGMDSLNGGEIILDNYAEISLTSALLIIAPYAFSPFTFTATTADLINNTNIDLTCAVMADFGVLVHRIHQGQWIVPVPQRYQAKDYVIEPDMGIAAYFFAAAAITGGEITIQPIKRLQSKQPSTQFLSLLEKMGCKVFETHEGLTVKASPSLQGIDVGLRKFSDTFLALSMIAPFAKSPTKISHLGQPTNKEIVRLTAVKQELSNMGIRVEANNHSIQIFPGVPQGCPINIYSDHRVTMAFAMLGLKIRGITIPDNSSITHHYPEFFNVLNRLANEININA